VLDPFLGGGTTGVVALDLGCRFIGYDVDQIAVGTALNRMREYGDAA
jgi:DNA modification methylase